MKGNFLTAVKWVVVAWLRRQGCEYEKGKWMQALGASFGSVRGGWFHVVPSISVRDPHALLFATASAVASWDSNPQVYLLITVTAR